MKCIKIHNNPFRSQCSFSIVVIKSRYRTKLGWICVIFRLLGLRQAPSKIKSDHILFSVFRFCARFARSKCYYTFSQFHSTIYAMYIVISSCHTVSISIETHLYVMFSEEFQFWLFVCPLNVVMSKHRRIKRNPTSERKKNCRQQNHMPEKYAIQLCIRIVCCCICCSYDCNEYGKYQQHQQIGWVYFFRSFIFSRNESERDRKLKKILGWLSLPALHILHHTNH